MSLFRDKLARLEGVGPKKPAQAPLPVSLDAPKDERLAQLRAALGALSEKEQKKRDSARIDRLAAAYSIGEKFEGEGGEFQLVQKLYAHDHHHGRVCIHSARRMSAGHLGMLALDEAIAGVDLSRAVFLDTETTGLSGGTGTVPFLVGLGYFEDDGFVLEQTLLTSYGHETAMLRHVASRIANASAVVSFNGKSFDWPLLRTRFLLSRLAVPALPPHIDLLHCARRVFKRRVESMRLTQLETEVFGFEREDDVSGAEVPGIYLEWIKGRDDGRMRQVVEHNALDIVALAALVAYFAERMDDPYAFSAEDGLGVAEVALRAKNGVSAMGFARAASELGASDTKADATAFVGKLHAREREADESIAAYEDALTHARCDRADIHLALSKLYEHRRKDYAEALVHAEKAVDAEPPEASAKRLARLRRKVQDSETDPGRLRLT